MIDNEKGKNKEDIIKNLDYYVLNVVKKEKKDEKYIHKTQEELIEEDAKKQEVYILGQDDRKKDSKELHGDDFVDHIKGKALDTVGKTTNSTARHLNAPFEVSKDEMIYI